MNENKFISLEDSQEKAFLFGALGLCLGALLGSVLCLIATADKDQSKFDAGVKAGIEIGKEIGSDAERLAIKEALPDLAACLLKDHD